jgi:fumarylpyruvate hydrolase
MSDYFFPPMPPVWVAIHGRDERYPVHRIYCVGKNYAEHAREMGSDPEREPPCFFSKPADAVTPGSGEVPYPPGTDNLHHEIELVVALGAGGRDLTPVQALDRVAGYAVGVDLTRRDLQAAAKKRGLPWDTAKGFDFSAPISPITLVQDGSDLQRGRIWLEVNGEMRQQADIADMTWSVGEVLAHLSRLFDLRAGDLVFTGTPAGVGPLKPGDRLRGGVDGLQQVDFLITPARSAGAGSRGLDPDQGELSGVGADCQHWPAGD